MAALLKELWRLCLFRSSPARLPSLPVVAIALLIADWFASVFIIRTLSPEFDATRVLLNIAVAQLALAALVLGMLRLGRKSERWAQTMSGLYGCDLLLTLLFGMLLPIARSIGPSPGNMMEILLFLWTVTIYGYIVHLAMEIPLLAGMLAALGILIVGFSFSEALVGTTGS
ncbi:MAG: hypothetical protein AB8B93_19595 [Pseudomonadales bacterium]